MRTGVNAFSWQNKDSKEAIGVGGSWNWTMIKKKKNK